MVRPEADVTLSFSSSALLLVYQAGVAEAFLSSPQFMASVREVHGCSGGALVGALLLAGEEALLKVKAYLQSGQAFRGIGFAEICDPARLIPRAVEESGAMSEDTYQRLSGRLHVMCTKGGMFRHASPVSYSSFDSNEELVQMLQATSSFAYEGVSVKGEAHWDGGISDVLPVPEHCDKERVVTVAPVCARHVSVCPDAGLWRLPGSFGQHGWRICAQSLMAAWDCTFMFSSRRMMKYWEQGRADGEVFLRSRGYVE